MAGFDYVGRVAAITGASSGIGRCIALDLARRGVRVAIMARREERLRAVAEEIRAAGGDAVVRTGSVSERACCEALVCDALEAWGRIDFLVNNAGVNRQRNAAHMGASEVENMLGVNFLGAVYGTLAALPGMLERGEGWIINMGSGASHMALPDQAAYAATKHALRGWSEGLWYDLRGRGIRVSIVSPGPIDTEMLEGLAREGGDSRLTDGSVAALPPDVVAGAVRRAIETGRFEVCAPPRYGLVYWLHDAFPALLRRAIARDAAKRQTSAELDQ